MTQAKEVVGELYKCDGCDATDIVEELDKNDSCGDCGGTLRPLTDKEANHYAMDEVKEK